MRFAYYSHHKCATGWTNSIVREVCFHTGCNHYTFHGVGNYSSFRGLDAVVREKDIEFLAFTNARISEVKKLRPHRGFHVVRDPRDVLVSAYYSHLYTHGTDNWQVLKSHREQLESLSKENGLLKEIQFSKQNMINMYKWDYNQKHILEIKMEELTASPSESFRRILTHLGLTVQSSGPIPWLTQKMNRLLYALNHRLGNSVPTHIRKEGHVHTNIFKSIMAYHEFKKVKKRDLKRRDGKKSHYRKGKSGDWRDHFTDRVANAFDREYRGIVRKLGYE
ncbi:sulfotransferase domain-containing protein [Salisaeta longa]|uniref:sulfotransferase domain-containing protein n=1 Tax=Salisaeta longa TaxID=503170 RepID=UPI000A0367D2|nr:sulfotransferase domain-containing protein [Salisaeta longa]